MIVTTGPIASVDSPAASRRRMPRSIASAAATACATEKQTVVLTLTPRALASSIASRPAEVVEPDVAAVDVEVVDTAAVVTGSVELPLYEMAATEPNRPTA